MGSHSYTDGEAFCKIRLYARQGDYDREAKWWSRLSDQKRKNLRLMQPQRFATVFDDLLEFPGLWRDLELGRWHSILSLRRGEEIWSLI